MRRVFIECPGTHRLVPTGLTADTLDELDEENVLADCPDCHASHTWKPVDAVLMS